jgi:hypoxanthine phosphoribosyltransferase
MTIPSLAECLTTAELLYGREALQAGIERMGAEIGRDFAGRRPVFLTLMHGGMIFAGHLALAIPIDCEFDYVHATRYRGLTTGSALHWVKAPKLSLQGRDVLLVDDILDEGKTLAAVRDWCHEQGATSVKIAVLTVKDHDRCVDGLRADYCGVLVPDRYVFGFGMDYYEQGRNLPGIYAVEGS